MSLDRNIEREYAICIQIVKFAKLISLHHNDMSAMSGDIVQLFFMSDSHIKGLIKASGQT